MQRLPLETQTLYAEFLAQLLATARHRSLGLAPGCFTTKSVKGETYYYFQYSDPGGRTRQAYVGKKSPALDRVVERFLHERADIEGDAARIQRLSAQLRIGGALSTDAAPARILKAFADAGIFQLGGVLIGTHAFAVMGNLLGVRWAGAYLKTQDIDIAGHSAIDIALPDLQADVPKILHTLEMGFVPVPPLQPEAPIHILQSAWNRASRRLRHPTMQGPRRYARDHQALQCGGATAPLSCLPPGAISTGRDRQRRRGARQCPTPRPVCPP